VPITYRSAPPLLGAQTHEVLAGRLAMSAADIEALRAKSLI
jgi:crotonobetainyl-CoA:carnitine CoA-transferase CaiB-like acyl-CoA transferase